MTEHLSEHTEPRRFNVVLPPKGRLGAWLFTSNDSLEAEQFAVSVPGAVVEDWSGRVVTHG